MCDKFEKLQSGGLEIAMAVVTLVTVGLLFVFLWLLF